MPRYQHRLTLLKKPLRVEGSASMTVSSDAQQVTVGKAVTFKVYVNPGETEVNAVGVNASYPTDSFEFVSISYEGSGFDIQAKEEVKDGAITIERGAAKNTSGETLVATITLKATKATSESGLTIEKDSKLIQSSNTKNILKTRQGAQIEVVEE
jgi:hypothetical protein